MAATRRQPTNGLEDTACRTHCAFGGVLVRMGGRTYDGTVRARLQALRYTLSGRPAGA